jgi:Ca-activated chloride channel family protein
MSSTEHPRHGIAPLVIALAVLAGLAVLSAAPGEATDIAAQRPTDQGFSFRTGVELVNVTVTVTDEHGRFVPGLRAGDFEIFENGERQAISQFDAERVPVSLGIALDTSGSMVGDKIVAAQQALDRFLFDLLGAQDEVFLYRFDSRPELVEGWTTDMSAVSRALGRVKPVGGTAIYDTLADAVPMAQHGSRRKKAIVVISDGNDTSSRTSTDEVLRLIRETEVLVYAIGIDASGHGAGASSARGAARSGPLPMPSPFPGQRAYNPPPSKASPPAPPSRSGGNASERLNIDTLRAITDDSGGRTEIIVSAQDLEPATAGIADELSQQYFIGYVSTLPKDGRWHTIDVRVRGGRYTVRARRGFVAG